MRFEKHTEKYLDIGYMITMSSILGHINMDHQHYHIHLDCLVKTCQNTTAPWVQALDDELELDLLRFRLDVITWRRRKKETAGSLKQSDPICLSNF